MIDQEMLVSKVRKALVAVLAGMAIDTGNRLLVHKTLGKYSDPAWLAIGSAIPVITENVDIPEDIKSIVGDVGDALIVLAAKDTVDVFMRGEPRLWAEDNKTLRVINLDLAILDASAVEVYVDGNKVNVSSVKGSKDDLTITLAATLSSGTHDIIVKGAKKAVYAKVTV